MKLYGDSYCPYAGRCRALIYAKALDIDILDTTVMNEDDWRRQSPTGKTPFLLVGDQAISDSGVICEYLEEKFPDKPLLPTTPEGRAMARTTAALAEDQILKKSMALLALLRPGANASKDILIDDFKLGLRSFDAYASRTNDNLCSTEFGWADCVVVPAILCAQLIGRLVGADTTLDKLGTIKSYWSQIGDTPVASRITTEMSNAVQRRFG